MVTSSFTLTMNPASDGDALLLRWSRGDVTRTALVDLGRTRDYRALRPTLADISVLDLLVITHIDADHIEGAVPLFGEAEPPFSARNVWFNAREQLARAEQRSSDAREALGAKQAERVTEGLLTARWPWNAHFASGVVSTDSPEAIGPIRLVGGLEITLLSPSDRKLRELIPDWDRELRKAGMSTADPEEVEEVLAEGRERMGVPNPESLAATRYKPDDTTPNGSSIAFVAEYDGRKVLMGADAHSEELEEALGRLGASKDNPYRLDCLKVSHHGSKANTSPALLRMIDCPRFAFSTNGTRHGHPDEETISRILVADPQRPKTLYFNFRQPKAALWERPDLQRRYSYCCVYPRASEKGMIIDLRLD
ncbi:MAG TPA: hypothetical protein VIL69_02630 [Roseomonas sp.]|jgi:beta-lactamase superfamily II metal-dependent hydrolase